MQNIGNKASLSRKEIVLNFSGDTRRDYSENIGSRAVPPTDLGHSDADQSHTCNTSVCSDIEWERQVTISPGYMSENVTK